jgi:hypothetical protein
MPLFNPLTASGNVTVQKGGAVVGSRPAVNFIEGASVSIAAVDNPGASDVDVTVAASVGGAAASGAYMVGTLSTWGEGSVMGDLSANSLNVWQIAGTWPVANLAIGCPVQLLTAVTIYQLAWLNGATVSGNVDIGIYNEAGTRLVSSGSTAQAGVSQSQAANTTDLALVPDTYFLVMSCDNVTATFGRYTGSFVLSRACGVIQQTAAFPLPATLATPFTAIGQAFVPAIAAIYELATF